LGLFLINLEGNDMSEQFAADGETGEILQTITIPIAEYEAMRLDAERYRYVRENPIVCIERWENIPLPANEVDVAVDEAIKAIDAAIKEGN
jgi:hypothetical protein